MQRIVGPRQTRLFDPCDPVLTEAYCFYLNVQYALNLEPVAQDLSVRSLERYIAYFEQDNCRWHLVWHKSLAMPCSWV